MTGTENIQALPIWVWLSFAIITVGIISIVYSQGKWRQTVLLMAIALLTVLFVTELSYLNTYLQTHFIGGYDHVGIPFIKAQPGWSLLLTAWPLWFLPVILTIVLTAVVCWMWHTAPKTSHEAETIVSRETEISTPITQNVAKQLETATYKQELITALHTIDKQAVDNQALEFKVRQLQKELQETTASFESRMRSLMIKNSE